MKLELKEWGFDFLDTLTKGATLDYGELTNYIPKYRLSNMHPKVFNYLLLQHIKKNCNVCLYFDRTANNAFAFNIDNNQKHNKDECTEEVKATVQILTHILNDVGIEPLVYASGRGYHIWVRLDEKIDNATINGFMTSVCAWTDVVLHRNNLDYNKVSVGMYPHKDEGQTHSLRIFGSNHIRRKTFSHVCTPEVLDEDASWNYFWDYCINKVITKKQFADACRKLDKSGQ
jgi:hypothetical protein